MRHFTSTFLKGLFTLLPILLSIYVLMWFLAFVERYTSQVLLVFWPEFLYVPGMGVMLAFILIYAVGTVVDRPWSKGFFNLVESLFSEVPVVKTVYLAIKDFTEYLRPGRDRKSNQVVLVRFPGVQVEMVGLMTREQLRDLPFDATKEDRVAVYFPMSYQFGGATVFIPRAWVTPTSMTVEAAMRSIITAWLPGQDKKLESM